MEEGFFFFVVAESMRQLDLLQGDSFIIQYIRWGQQYLTAAITITPYTSPKLPPRPIQRCQPLALDSDSPLSLSEEALLLHNSPLLHGGNDPFLTYVPA